MAKKPVKKTVKKPAVPKPQKSLVQQGADMLRQMLETIAKFEGIESSLLNDVENLETQLLVAKSNLSDTQSLLKAQREKLLREANNMHVLIEQSVKGDRYKAGDFPL